jgi:hypothetical protein
VVDSRIDGELEFLRRRIACLDRGDSVLDEVDVVVVDREPEESGDLVAESAVVRVVGAVLRHQDDERTVVRPVVGPDELGDAELEHGVE